MPCGGIYTIPEEDDMRKGGMCFVCRKSDCELFCEEWDCTLHIACLGRFLCSGEGEIVISHKHDIHVQYGEHFEVPLIPALRLAGQLIGDPAAMAEEIVRLNSQLEANGVQRVVTCIYCGHAYGPDDGTTPTSRAYALTRHAARCEQHPMKKFVDLVRRMHDLLTADLTLGLNPVLRKIGLEMEAELNKLK